MKKLIFIQFVIIFIFRNTEASTFKYNCISNVKEVLSVTIRNNKIRISGAISMLGNQQAMGNLQMAMHWAYFYNVKGHFVNQEVLVDLKMMSGNPGRIRYLTMNYGLQSIHEFSCTPVIK